jgi:hypothetical protein
MTADDAHPRGRATPAAAAHRGGRVCFCSPWPRHQNDIVAGEWTALVDDDAQLRDSPGTPVEGQQRFAPHAVDPAIAPLPQGCHHRRQVLPHRGHLVLVARAVDAHAGRTKAKRPAQGRPLRGRTGAGGTAGSGGKALPRARGLVHVSRDLVAATGRRLRVARLLLIDESARHMAVALRRRGEGTLILQADRGGAQSAVAA